MKKRSIPEGAQHGGSGATYVNYGCRCRLCREANARRVARRRRERYQGPLPVNAPHGSRSTYTNWGCRCQRCTQVHSAACKAYRASKSSPVARSVSERDGVTNTKP